MFFKDDSGEKVDFSNKFEIHLNASYCRSEDPGKVFFCGGKSRKFRAENGR